MSHLWTRTTRAACGLVVAAATLIIVTRADVLPEDRTDVMYHRYDGGGVTVDGPSVLVRKKIGDSFSASYQYYLDLITSASIDVLSQASKYKEHRTENHLGLDYLRGNTLYTIGWINSDEPDYKSNTGFFNVSQSMFGDLTTVSFGYSRGWDKVYEVEPHDLQGVLGEKTFVGDADHRTYSVGLSQVLTRNLLLGINYETNENAGYLRSPYRKVRFVDAGGQIAFQDANVPDTRTGNAVSAQAKYYLPWHAAVDGSYRYYTDTWDIQSHTVRLGYTQPWHAWTFDASARYYRQTAADFYSDLFAFENAQNFESRDRELAQFHSLTLGLGAEYDFKPTWPSFIRRGTLNADFQHMRIDYDDFRNNLVNPQDPAAEPLYSYGANIMQFFISVWY